MAKMIEIEPGRWIDAERVLSITALDEFWTHPNIDPVIAVVIDLGKNEKPSGIRRQEIVVTKSHEEAKQLAAEIAAKVNDATNLHVICADTSQADIEQIKEQANGKIAVLRRGDGEALPEVTYKAGDIDQSPTRPIRKAEAGVKNGYIPKFARPLIACTTVNDDYKELYEVFSDRAQMAMKLAFKEMNIHWHKACGRSHILLGLVKEGSGAAGTFLADHGVSVGAVRNLIFEPAQSEVALVKAEAFAEANRLGVRFVGTEHILLALMKHKDTPIVGDSPAMLTEFEEFIAFRLPVFEPGGPYRFDLLALHNVKTRADGTSALVIPVAEAPIGSLLFLNGNVFRVVNKSDKFIDAELVHGQFGGYTVNGIKPPSSDDDLPQPDVIARDQ